MGVVTDIVRVACNTSTGTQDITGSLGGLSAKAAIFILTKASVDGTLTPDAWLSFGFASGASNRAAGAYGATDAVTTGEVSNALNTAGVVNLINGAGTAQAVADFSAFIANGVRINWTTAPGTAYLLHVILFAGSDLSAHVGSFNMGNTVDTGPDVTDPGFEADVVVPFLVQATNGYEFSTGIVHNNKAGTVTQRALFWNSQTGLSSCRAAVGLRDDAGIVEGNNINAIDFDWWGEFGSFDASGFSCIARNAGGNNQTVYYLALSFGGAVDSAVVTYPMPTATGNNSLSSLSFTPQFVYLLGTMMTTINTVANSGDPAGVRMISGFTGSSAYAIGTTEQDNAATTVDNSFSDDTAIELPDDNESVGHTAAFVSMNADGWTLNHTAVKATADLFFALAIGEAAEAGGNENPWYVYAQQ